MPTRRAISVMDSPSANSKIIRARRTSPARRIVERCHDSSFSRSSSERETLTCVLRPRAMNLSSSKKTRPI